MNRVQVARAAFAISASGTLLAIALLGAGPFEDPSHPSTLPPWAIEPSDGVPLAQTPLLPATALERFAVTGYPMSAICQFPQYGLGCSRNASLNRPS